MTNWKEIDRLAKSWVKEAGQRIKQSMKEKMTIETKSNPNDLVTNIDKETERFFIKAMEKKDETQIELSKRKLERLRKEWIRLHG
ncbi:hypothetical protein DT075_22855 [Bacillus licheniformis]|nr:hypothetical protein DT075_22855 [Bacillus licheniformis]